MVVCVAINCANRSSRNKAGVSFHRFPQDDRLKKVWLVKLKRDHYHPSADDRVCSEHFDPSSYEDNSLKQRLTPDARIKPTLKKDAVPTIFNFHLGVGDENAPKPAVQRGAYAKRRVLEESARKQQVVRVLTLADDAPCEMEHVEDFGMTPLQSSPPKSISRGSGPDAVQQLFKSVQHVVKTNVKSVQTLIERTPTISMGIQVQPATCAQSSQTSWTTPETAEASVQCELITPQLGADQDSDQDSESDGEEHEDDFQTSSHSEDPDFEDVCSDMMDDCDEDDEEDIIELLEEPSSPDTERKFIVFESCLRSLLSICYICGAFCTTRFRQVMGTLLVVDVVCLFDATHTREWQSQPILGKMAIGNLFLAAGTLFSGCSPVKAVNLMKQMNVAVYSLRTYYRIQKHYLLPAVTNVWKCEQAKLIKSSRGHFLKLGGDARCCSPGHTAKYASYSLMDLQTSKVLATNLVQSSEVKNSQAMELEGLKRALQFLEKAGLQISDLTTDRHGQVRKWLREKKSAINHWFDVWHMAKAENKKILKAAKKDQCEILGVWAKSYSNHMYWCASSSNGDGKLVLAKWLSVERHMTNVHKGHGKLHKKCEHGPLDRKWIKKGSRAHAALTALVQRARLQTDVQRLSPAEQTSSLESFHNVVCYFATKRLHFFYHAMEARVILAVLHFNENSDRPQAKKKQDDSNKWQLSYPKSRGGEAVVKEVKVPMTYGYAAKLMAEVWRLKQLYPSYKLCRKKLLAKQTKAPPAVSHKHTRVQKDVAVAARQSRFNKK